MDIFVLFEIKTNFKFTALVKNYCDQLYKVKWNGIKVKEINVSIFLSQARCSHSILLRWLSVRNFWQFNYSSCKKKLKCTVRIIQQNKNFIFAWHKNLSEVNCGGRVIKIKIMIKIHNIILCFFVRAQ